MIQNSIYATDSCAPRDETKETAQRIGLEIETAVAHDNLQDYRMAMNHATEYMKSHPQQRDIFKNEVEARFKRDGAFAGIIDFELVHADTDGESTISRQQISEAKMSRSANAIQKDLLTEAEENYDLLPPYFWSLNLTNASRSKITERLHEEQQRLLPGNQLRNFFEKDEEGYSLYDRVKDENGNVRYGLIAKLQTKPDLTAAERDTLASIDRYQRSRYYLFGDRGMSKADLENVANANGMKLEDLTGQKQVEDIRPCNGEIYDSATTYGAF